MTKQIDKMKKLNQKALGIADVAALAASGSQTPTTGGGASKRRPPLTASASSTSDLSPHGRLESPVRARQLLYWEVVKDAVQ